MPAISYDIAHSIDGVITFAFDAFAIELLSNPTVFAQLSLSHLQSFRSIYATKLYEVMAIRERRDNRVWEPSIDEFKEMMGITEGYDRFDNLNRRVVIPAHHEVNEIAPFGVQLDYVRGGVGGRVIGMRFETVPRDRRTLLDAALPHPVPSLVWERPRDPDLFDGVTDAERAYAVSAAALARAAEMMGPTGDPEEEVQRWRNELVGRRIRSPDRSFLNWLDLRVAAASGARKSDLGRRR